MMIPTIIIHSGYAEYVDIVAARASRYNKVILMTDADYPQNRGYEVADIKNIYNFDAANINKLSQTYVHLYKGQVQPVLFWIIRWFLLLNFCKMRNINVVFHIDSDVLLFTDPNENWEKNQYSNFIMTLILGSCGSTSYFTLEGLQLLVDMIIKVYADKGQHFDMLQQKYELHTKYGSPGGVCDMALLKMFKEHDIFGGGYNRIGEMTYITNDTTYDHNINVTDMDYSLCKTNNIKDIQIINNKPYIFNNRLGRNILFNGLHFQGRAKSFIQSVDSLCDRV